jgi:transcriptional regulator with XRE-family HTH domain
MASDAPGRRSLADKLDHLFSVIHPAKGEYTYDQVSKAIEERGGPTISAAYIWQLRKGVRDNPTKRHLEALAEFFGVPPSYFFDEQAAHRVDAELELLAALRDHDVRQVALRASGLSSGSLAAIAAMIEQARQLEGLKDNGDFGTGPE